MPDNKMTGLVIFSPGSSYRLLDCGTGLEKEAVLRGKIRLGGIRTTNPVAVGDIVEYEVNADGTNLITAIRPRTNYVIRRASNLSKESHIIASNLDQAAIVVTLVQPETKTEFVDRFLVTCEAYGIPAFLILNKSDLYTDMPEYVRLFSDIYRSAGYDVIALSTLTGEGMGHLASRLEGKTTLVSGNSGVGKSSIIREMIPGCDIRTAPVSDYHNKGRHTTTFARMYDLPGRGRIIDTPGIKGFGLLEIGMDEMARYFPEFMAVSPHCQFYNCTHVHEPGCAVMRAVEQGIISESRYVNYLKMLEEDEKYRK